MKIHEISGSAINCHVYFHHYTTNIIQQGSSNRKIVLLGHQYYYQIIIMTLIQLAKTTTWWMYILGKMDPPHQFMVKSNNDVTKPSVDSSNLIIQPADADGKARWQWSTYELRTIHLLRSPPLFYDFLLALFVKSVSPLWCACSRSWRRMRVLEIELISWLL